MQSTDLLSPLSFKSPDELDVPVEFGGGCLGQPLGGEGKGMLDIFTSFKRFLDRAATLAESTSLHLQSNFNCLLLCLTMNDALKVTIAARDALPR